MFKPAQLIAHTCCQNGRCNVSAEMACAKEISWQRCLCQPVSSGEEGDRDKNAYGYKHCSLKEAKERPGETVKTPKTHLMKDAG